MRGRLHAPTRRILGLSVTGALLLAGLPGTANATADRVTSLPRCDTLAASAAGDSDVSTPWRALLDDDGELTGHRLTLRLEGRERQVRTGRRGFALRFGDDRTLIGERFDDGTRLDMIDPRRGCRLWSRQLDRAAYPDDRAPAGRLRLALHDPRDRGYRQSAAIDLETGQTEAVTEEVCLEGCYPTDGAISVAALQPAGTPRPTPNFPAGGWPKDKTLTFHWKAGAWPPAWARIPLQSAADDVRRTSVSRSPRFVYRTDGANAVAYTGTLPGFCSSQAIACARRSMPTYWGVWIRPYGTDLPWGTLRWCQKTSSSSSCFDLRRVMLHELGHIVGLDHPSSGGFTLASADSVMQGITPARPAAGASRHAFGRCDVATLQELYDTPDNKTDISTCNDVATTVTLSTGASSVARGASVKLTAVLRVDSRSAYRQLSGNWLNGRSLKLKYRRAGSADAWKTAWMRPTYQQGRYVLTIAPVASWEFKAVFPKPDDEGLRYSRSVVKKVKVTN